MSAATSPAPRAVDEGPVVEFAGPWRIAWRRLRRDRIAVASGIIFVVLLFACFPGAKIASALLGHGPDDLYPYAVGASTLRPDGPWAHVPDTHVFAPTSNDLTLVSPPPPKGTPRTLFVLGADGPLGRDLLLRVLYGGRVSLEVGIGATLIALVLGVGLGTVAGWYGGIVDGAVARLSDLVMALPVLLLVLMVGTGLGEGLRNLTFGGVLNRGVFQLILLIGAFSWYYPARIVRAEMLSLRGREFVESAVMIGARGVRIIRTHLFPHLVPSLVVYGTIMVATSVMLEVGVTFLGAGIEPPTSSWGTLLQGQYGSVLTPVHSFIQPESLQPWITVFPCLAIFLTVFALNQLADGLREALDPSALR
jgi:peptide/nickel transport system permease protein